MGSFECFSPFLLPLFLVLLLPFSESVLYDCSGHFDNSFCSRTSPFSFSKE